MEVSEEESLERDMSDPEVVEEGELDDGEEGAGVGVPIPPNTCSMSSSSSDSSSIVNGRLSICFLTASMGSVSH